MSELNNAEKWKTSSERVFACQRYCEYLEEGNSPEYYPEAAPATITRYREKYPSDFDTEKIERAERIYKKHCADILKNGSMGLIDGFNAPSAIFRAKNILGMKDSQEIDHKNLPPIPTELTIKIARD